MSSGCRTGCILFPTTIEKWKKLRNKLNSIRKKIKIIKYISLFFKSIIKIYKNKHLILFFIGCGAENPWL
jgi:hypothetical protein